MATPPNLRAGAPAGRTDPELIDLSVVIPAYNEQDRLGATLDEVCAHLATLALRWELIVVDDGSTDRTAAIAAAAASTEPRMRTMRWPVNRGKGHAVRLGVLASRGGQVLFSDADLSTPITELARLRSELQRGGSVAIGSRVQRIGPRQHPLRELLGRAGNRMIQAVAVPGIADTQCGFKLFDGDLARQVFGMTRVDGWGFDIEVLYLFSQLGYPVVEVPVAWAHHTGSKVRPSAYLKVLAELLQVRLVHRHHPRPVS